MCSAIVKNMGQLAFWNDVPPPRKRTARSKRVRTMPAPTPVRGHGDALAEQYAAHAHAERTKALYRGDWQRFAAWCASRGDAALPAHPRVVGAYLAALAASGRKPSTIRRARIAVGLAHYYAGMERPDRDPHVRLVEKGIRRTVGAAQQHSAPLLPDHLEAMMAVLPTSLSGDRDRALLLVGWAGAFRRSEVVSLRLEDLTFLADGDAQVLLRRSKRDNEGKGETVLLEHAFREALCPIRALRRWLGHLRSDRGPLFRPVVGKHVQQKHLHPTGVDRAVRRAAALAGLSAEGHSAHSLRSGWASTAVRAGVPEREVAERGRWHPGSLGPYVAPHKRRLRLL